NPRAGGEVSGGGAGGNSGGGGGPEPGPAPHVASLRGAAPSRRYVSLLSARMAQRFGSPNSPATGSAMGVAVTSTHRPSAENDGSVMMLHGVSRPSSTRPEPTSNTRTPEMLSGVSSW